MKIKSPSRLSKAVLILFIIFNKAFFGKIIHLVEEKDNPLGLEPVLEYLPSTRRLSENKPVKFVTKDKPNQQESEDVRGWFVMGICPQDIAHKATSFDIFSFFPLLSLYWYQFTQFRTNHSLEKGFRNLLYVMNGTYKGKLPACFGFS